ncbi:unnamed protein product [Closterium sp. NIES-53]
MNLHAELPTTTSPTAVIAATSTAASTAATRDPTPATSLTTATTSTAAPTTTPAATSTTLALAAAVLRASRISPDGDVMAFRAKKDVVVSCEDFLHAVPCFTQLTHLYLSGPSVKIVDDDFLARLKASTCHHLTAFHMGTSDPSYQCHDRESPFTQAGLDSFFRHFSQLVEMSLCCLHPDFMLPASVFELSQLRILILSNHLIL